MTATFVVWFVWPRLPAVSASWACWLSWLGCFLLVWLVPTTCSQPYKTHVLGAKKLDGDWTVKEDVCAFLATRMKKAAEDADVVGAAVDNEGNVVECLEPDIGKAVVKALIAGQDAPSGSGTMSELRSKIGHGVVLAREILKDRRVQLNNRFIEVGSRAHRHTHIKTIEDHKSIQGSLEFAARMAAGNIFICLTLG